MSYFKIEKHRVLKKELDSSRDYGLTLPDTPNVNYDVQYIRFSTEDKAKRGFLHSRLGFCEIGKQMVFLEYEIIGISEKKKALSKKNTSLEKTTPRSMLQI